MWPSKKAQLMEVLSYAVSCKKQYPKYQVKNERVTQHVLIGKGGNEILRANSFLGLVGMMLITIVLTIITVGIIAMIFSGISNLFSGIGNLFK